MAKKITKNPRSIKKAVNKAVHKGIVEARVLSIEPIGADLKKELAKLPKKIAAKEKNQIASLKKAVNIKKIKKPAKKVKSTLSATPEHVHTEGKRWIATTKKQIKNSSKRLTKKLLKKKK